MSGALTRNEDWRKNRLRLLREAEGLSQADLSHLLGVSQQMICKWENEETPISRKYELCITRLFHCSSDYLFYRTSKRDLATDDEDFYNSLDEEEQRVFRNNMSLYWEDKSITVKTSMKQFLTSYPIFSASPFIQINQSEIININFVSSVKKQTCILLNGRKMYISRKYYSRFREKYYTTAY